ncbi:MULTISPECIES: DUF2252 domain-containing protein [Micromonospora]|uniref:DUF2252 domain-containing protein n=1 Tax=Micromonospora solifontis TaxID=2487138 RepID=A0ABX9WCB1_9ACTN|nr:MULTISPECIES: DUF2252 domain-containing protein [Micromonospora]NES12555.1 DUF2252 domain-containing protein [Micromonospora sp. PPF5-17B]NES39180.1 DUF2252 domain-containing protein [Micromonospora solifontis]NES54560.1 DUF2252 domain-containing protein [Micromonospora sp. PPF5-6]RNL90367.1 DUF2252 domain-containing protein [Micromonospora solifontis]
MTESADKRSAFIVDVLTEEFGASMALDPAAFRRKFRKMAASPFAFYRGSASLFYADQRRDFASDRFLDERTSRVWIHGDLHAENFGTYMNGSGQLVFNVNDFDEAYVGPFSWDLKRFAASVALLGYAKALSDRVIGQLVAGFARSYLTELRAIAAGGDDAIGSITLENADGVLRRVLQQARLNTRVDLLAAQTTIDNYERRFSLGDGVFEIDAATREKVCAAFHDYLGTLPEATARLRPVAANIKDVVLRKGVGIGSAGLPSYNLLLEGHTQALENDVVIYMKQAQVPAVARHIDDERVRSYFRHQGHRTAESQRALQAHADPWVGFTELDGAGQLVAEVSPYAADLDWADVNEPEELSGVLTDLGRAVARMHSVADDESSHDLVDYSTEESIVAVVDADPDGFVGYLVDFAHAYGIRAREDHQLFVDLFRNGRLPGI